MESLESKEQPPRLTKPVKITEQVWPAGTVPVVSVFNWAYNHVGFIRESIESILMQETIFPVEIIIHDDASTDGTTEIIREYEAKYPQLFRNIIQTENQWSQGKSLMVPLCNAPRGDFVALTHGDDYWTSQTKLQMQVEMLEANPASALAGAYAHVLDEITEQEPERNWFIGPFPAKPRYKLEELFSQGIHTSTLMFRRRLLNFPDWSLEPNLTNGDVVLQTLGAEKRDVVFADCVVSRYRRHSGGVWTGVAVWKKYKDAQRTWSKVDRHLGFRYTNEIALTQTTFARGESNRLMRQGRVFAAYAVLLATARTYFPKKFLFLAAWALKLPFELLAMPRAKRKQPAY